MMREDILWRTKHLKAVRIFLARKGDKIVGWSSVIRPCEGVVSPVSMRSKLLPIYTYVMRKHRRQSIGKRLVKAASKWIVREGFKPKVIAWDNGSLRFFDKCKINYGANIRITKDFYEVA
jgi:GNAT superfamily N-acetyltransferase